MDNYIKKIEGELFLFKKEVYNKIFIFNLIKIAITIVILSWLIYTSYQINYDPVKYEKYAKIHAIWFGGSSPINIIIALWIFSLFVFFTLPLVKMFYNIGKKTFS